jgi:hypothetical protein
VDALGASCSACRNTGTSLSRGLVLRGEGAAEVSPEPGLVDGGGQQLRVYRRGGLQGLAVCWFPMILRSACNGRWW